MTDAAQTTVSPFNVGRTRSRAHVQPVSQVLLRLDDEGDGKTFRDAQRQILQWIEHRAGYALPPEAWKGEAFELEEIGAQRTAAISIDKPVYWAARLDDSDRSVAKRTWVTEVSLANPNDKFVAFGARLQCVTLGGEFAIQPSVPGFVRSVVEQAPGVRLEGRRLGRDPWFVRTADDVGDLVELIEDRSRALDVIVCSLPDNSEDPSDAFVDVGLLHRRTLGVAHLAVISGAASFLLTERLGREFSVFRSAVRSYRPGFDVGTDEPFRHPLTLAARIASWPGDGPRGYEQFLIGTAILRSTYRHDLERQLPPFADVKRAAAQIRRESPDGRSIDAGYSGTRGARNPGAQGKPRSGSCNLQRFGPAV
ncbi:MAG: hypothetical protein K2X72_38990 [Reyranella sp.]|nr:hypothetical protein [Reyranella sp.]